MPKASDIDHGHKPVEVEQFLREKGADPYGNGSDRRPVDVPLDGDIEQFAPPSRFPAPEVVVECLGRGVKDRGFIFGRGAQWGTTWERAKELAGQTKIIKELTPRPDADASTDH